ncbi:SpoIID/LytB domain-containing protein [Georgenia phoenicis]|uniref:SpoIID/LytB domain-containing protein n=1 Tax=unclassified Georgenia TaxID=2626815 RepID=UPI0039AFDDC1
MYRRRVAASVGSVLALLLSMLVVTAAPASAAEERYDVPAGGAWEVQGRGWGHGVGMSQWGSQGAATKSGLNYRQILDFYYPGTTMNTVPDRLLRVALTAYAPADTVTLQSPLGISFSVAGKTVAPGRLTITRTGSEYRIEHRTKIDATPTRTWNEGGATLAVSAGGNSEGGGVVVLPRQNATDGTWYRGTINLVGGAAARTFDVVNHVNLEQYLRGVVPRESPSSWHLEALKAQAVAARSYGLSVMAPNAAFDLCDTDRCQVYGGRAAVVTDGETFRPQPKEAASTDRAIRETAGQVRWYQGAVAFTQFSSTNGGHTAPGSRPYLVAKPDPYTGTATGDSRTTWTDTLQVSTLQQYCPNKSQLRTLVITERDGYGQWGGRITGIRLECTGGNVKLTSEPPADDEVRNTLRFGMYSNFWKPTAGVEPPSGFYLNDSWGPQANHEFAFGRPGDVAISGDWDGNGTDTVGIRRGNTYHLTNAHQSRTARTIAYGKPADEVLIGDWDGDGVDTLAVRRGRMFYINNSIASGPATTVIAYGKPGDQVLVGDWDGNGTDTLAVRRGHMYHVRNTMTSGPAHSIFGYGRPGDAVLAGDWDGNGTDTLAVRRGNIYHVKNSLAAGPADRVVPYGRAGDVVLVGDWDGNGTDTLGVHRVQ